MDNRPGQTTQRAVLMAAAVSASISGACFGQGIACRYEVLATVQGPPCGILATITTATAINNHGTVVGHYRCQAGNPRPFVWTETNGFQFVPLPSWLLEASPADINDNNIMVGTGVGPVAGQRGFVCDLNTGVWEELLPQNPPIGWSGATGINNSNVVCGWRSLDDGGDPVHPQTAFTWRPENGFTDLGLVNRQSTAFNDISDSGILAGWAGAGMSVVGTRGLLGSLPFPDVLPVIPGGSSSACLAVNARGVGVGHGRLPGIPGPDVVHAIIWDGKWTEIGLLPNMLRSFALDISNDETVVGYCRTLSTGEDVIRAYVWRYGHMRDLNSLIESEELNDLSVAFGISQDGRIVGQGQDKSGAVVGFVLRPVVVVGDAFPDCRVNIDDLLTVIQWWGPGESSGDINGDGVVDIQDLVIVIENWTF